MKYDFNFENCSTRLSRIMKTNENENETEYIRQSPVCTTTITITIINNREKICPKPECKSKC